MRAGRPRAREESPGISAERELRQAGAVVRFSTYNGGHGWHDAPFARIRDGVTWLEEQSDVAPADSKQPVPAEVDNKQD